MLGEQPEGDHWFELGEAANKSGDFELAVESFLRSAVSDNSAIAIFNAANAAVACNQFVAAEALFKIAAALGETDAIYNLGHLYEASGRLAEAKVIYRKAWEEAQDPKAPGSLAMLIEEQDKDYDLALSWYEKANTPATLNRRLQLLIKLGHTEKAFEILKLATTQEMLSPLNRASLLLAANRGAEAEGIMRAALRSGDGTVGVLLSRRFSKTDSEAITVLRHAVHLGDVDAEVELGLHLWIGGNRDDAIKHWRSAVSQGNKRARKLLRQRGLALQ